MIDKLSKWGLAVVFLLACSYTVFSFVQREETSETVDVVANYVYTFSMCEFPANEDGLLKTERQVKSLKGLIKIMSKHGTEFQDKLIELRQAQICCQRIAKYIGGECKVDGD
jgi:hypothetical protein